MGHDMLYYATHRLNWLANRGSRSALVLTVAFAALGALGPILAPPVLAQPGCKPGFVPRNAYAGDVVCVSPQRRQEVANENRDAASHRSPVGGASGANTCLPGFVWRLAVPADLVCVSPDARDKAAEDNADAASHVAAAASSAAAVYQLSEWSAWTHVDGADYRYRFGWNPKAPNFPTYIDAIFEVKNRTATNWPGAVRAVDCKANVLGMGEKQFTLRSGETQTLKFVTTNCGSSSKPFFKPSVVRSSTY
jgi:hypothetical protein